MKYGQLAGNTSINTAIYNCFSLIDEQDGQRLARRFRQYEEDDQLLHTYRELLIGGYLSSVGHRAKYDYPIGGKTPDWTVMAQDKPACVVEVVNCHIDYETERSIRDQKRQRSAAAWYPDDALNLSRVRSTIHTKAIKYKELVAATRTPFVVAAFTPFNMPIERSMILSCLTSGDGIFAEVPELSGVLHFFNSNGGTYDFHFFSNPHCDDNFDLQSGCWTP